MTHMHQIEDMVRQMEDLCAEGGLPPFDRVRFAMGTGEVWFLWEESKLAVVVEATAGPAELAASLAGATAGDAVLN